MKILKKSVQLIYKVKNMLCKTFESILKYNNAFFKYLYLYSNTFLLSFQMRILILFKIGRHLYLYLNTCIKDLSFTRLHKIINVNVCRKRCGHLKELIKIIAKISNQFSRHFNLKFGRNYISKPRIAMLVLLL